MDEGNFQLLNSVVFLWKLRPREDLRVRDLDLTSLLRYLLFDHWSNSTPCLSILPLTAISS